MWKSRPLLACAFAIMAVPVLAVVWVLLTLLVPVPALAGSLNFVLPLLCLAAWIAIFYFLRFTPWTLAMRLVAWALSAPLILLAALVALMLLFWNAK